MVKDTIGKIQTQILKMIIEEHLSVKEIAQRRKTTIWAVYNIIRKLTKKGLIRATRYNLTNPSPIRQTHPPIEQPKIRLHNEAWHCKILYAHERYQAHISHPIKIDNNTVQPYKQVVIIHSTHSFYGATTKEARDASLSYWRGFMGKVEDALGVILVKPKTLSIKRFRAHYSHLNNPMASKAEATKDKVFLRGKADGVVWLVIDNSDALHEMETIHPSTAHVDMQQVIEPYFQDMKENKPPTNSSLYGMIAGNTKTISEVITRTTEIAMELQTVVGILKVLIPPQPPASQEAPGDKPDYFG